jgi:tetratricopeptide (TPR) repeat protein
VAHDDRADAIPVIGGAALEGQSKSAIDEAALRRAQELIYDAWEEGTARRRVALAKKALAITPLCADAYALLAGHAEPGSDEELDLWRHGLEAGKAALGEAAFDEYLGSFWGFLETRPYMRARHGLAQALWRRGARDEAIDHLRDMLRLNPNDNQGIRYTLASYLVETERDQDLAALLALYQEGGAAWTWTAALVAFRRAGDCLKSRKLLAEALASNTHVLPYLSGKRRLPKQVPPYIGVGDDDEAVYYVTEFGAGWTLTPSALEWLSAQAPALMAPKPRSRRPTLQ